MSLPYLTNRDRMDYYRPHEKSSLSTSVLAQIRRVYLGKAGGFSLWGVDCDAVLGNRVDLDFTNGGNGGRYRYCPENELWVDMAYPPPRAAHTLVHEGIEAPLMIHRGLSYDNAHDIANVHEDVVLQAIRRGDVILRSYPEAVRFVDMWLREAAPRLSAGLSG